MFQLVVTEKTQNLRRLEAQRNELNAKGRYGISSVIRQSFFIPKQSQNSRSGSGCSKLTTLLVNILLKFQMLISEIRQYFLLKKFANFCFLYFFNKKYQYIW